MKFMKIVSVVALLGLIGAAQVKASIVLPGERNLSYPNLVTSLPFKNQGQSVISAVPEPSDWAWLPVLGTVGVIAWRRFARKSAV